MTNDITTTHSVGRYYFRSRRRNRILVDGRALLCYDCATTVLPVTYRVRELLYTHVDAAGTYPSDKVQRIQTGCSRGMPINIRPVVNNSIVLLKYY